MSMYDFDDDGAATTTARKLLVAGVAVAVIALGWLVVLPKLGGQTSAGLYAPSASGATSTTVLVESAQPVPSTSAPTAVTTTVAPAAPATTATSAYSTLPDGTPQPVLVTFDVDTITMSGTVPSRRAAERLAFLAQANSKTPAQVVNMLTIDPNVPIGVGVRVVELTSSRFPEGSAEVVGEHAAELDRVAVVMNAFPNVTLMVVGHADQRGSADSNYRLSELRAQAVVTYLVSKGVASSRMASRAVGESDLLSLDDDDTALALNRRTEFIFYGILIEQ